MIAAHGIVEVYHKSRSTGFFYMTGEPLVGSLVVQPASADHPRPCEFVSDIEDDNHLLVGIFHDEYQPQDGEVVRELISDHREGRERLAAQKAEASSSSTDNQPKEALPC
jgi:hypothetical protein